MGQNLSSPLAQHIPQQIPSYVVQNQLVQSPLHQTQQLQQNSQQQSVHSPLQNAQQLQQSLQHQLVNNPQQPVQNFQQIGADRGPGAIPRPGNPFYVPITNVINTPPTTFIASTPPAQVQYVHGSPNLSPISLRAPPGFVSPPHEQRSNQVHNTGLNRNIENNSRYNRTQDPLELENGRQAPLSNAQNTLGPFKPLKGAEYLPTSAPGCILNTNDEQLLASEMWLKASLDLLWESSGHIPTPALITHLENFNYQSQAINPFIINRLKTNTLLWPSEVEELKRNLNLQGINETLGYTNDLNKIDDYLLGNHNWHNASEASIDLDERRYLIWVTQFTPRDRMLGWEREDWNSITPRDLKLFFAILLKYPMSFATAFYIAINQLSREQLVKRMGLGGLYSIKPAVFLNILRIITIAKNLKEWRNWPIDSVIPKLIHFNAI